MLCFETSNKKDNAEKIISLSVIGKHNIARKILAAQELFLCLKSSTSVLAFKIVEIRAT